MGTVGNLDMPSTPTLSRRIDESTAGQAWVMQQLLMPLLLQVPAAVVACRLDTFVWKLDTSRCPLITLMLTMLVEYLVEQFYGNSSTK